MASNHHFLLNPKQTLKAKKSPGKFIHLTSMHPRPKSYLTQIGEAQSHCLTPS